MARGKKYSFSRKEDEVSMLTTERNRGTGGLLGGGYQIQSNLLCANGRWGFPWVRLGRVLSEGATAAPGERAPRGRWVGEPGWCWWCQHSKGLSTSIETWSSGRTVIGAEVA